MFKRMPPSAEPTRRVRIVRSSASTEKVPVIQPGRDVPIRQIKSLISSFILDQRVKGCTDRTIGNYEDVLSKLRWWLEKAEVEALNQR